MLYQWLRVLYSDNGVVTDYSIEAQNDTVPAVMVAAEDYIYVGQYYPFNNIYFELSVANTNASVMSVEYWNSKQFVPAVDILDATKVAGATFARNGVIQFSPDIDHNWGQVRDTSKADAPTHLQGREMYDLYWVRLKVSADLSASTALKRVGYSFATNAMLAGIDPEISQYLTPWGGSSKLNWDEQIQLASLHLVADLRSRGIVVHGGNILRFDDVALATAYRSLAIIYGPLGQAFDSRRQQALEQYEKLLNVKRFTIDQNTNGLVDRAEINNTVGNMIR